MKNKSAFTLVELVIVISILAILGLIAFISIDQYTKYSRDSVRLSDTKLLETSLEIFSTESGYYPLPIEGKQISYNSGITVWIQGTISDYIIRILGDINTKPIDPSIFVEYTYSVLNTKQEFEISTIIESNIARKNSFFEDTYAEDKIVRTRVVGNYNGLIAKVCSGNLNNVLALPSIIASDLSELDLETLINNNNLIYNNYNNLASNYNNTGFDVKGGGELNFVDNILVFSGSFIELLEESSSGHVLRKEFIFNLQNAYKNTLLKNIDDIVSLLKIDIENISSSESRDYIKQIMSNEYCGISIKGLNKVEPITINYTCDNSTKPFDNGHIIFSENNPTVQNQGYIKDAINCGYSCKDGYIGNNCEIAPVLCNLSDTEQDALNILYTNRDIEVYSGVDFNGWYDSSVVSSLTKTQWCEAKSLISSNNLPIEIIKLTNLEYLDLSYNCIV